MRVGIFLFLSAPIVRWVKDSFGSAVGARARASRARASIRFGIIVVFAVELAQITPPSL